MKKKASKPKVKRKSAKRWGVSTVSSVQRKAKDGTTYTEYRFPYIAQVVTLSQSGEPIGIDAVRRFAASSESPAAAQEKAKAKAAEAKQLEEDFWRDQRRRRGDVEPDVPVPVEITPRRINLIDCAREMMKSRVRYEDNVITTVRFSYERKQESYINILKLAPFSSHPMDTLTPASVSSWFIDSYLKDHSQTTAARFKGWLLQVGSWGVINRYWVENVFQHLPRLSKTATKEDARVYSLGEIDRMWLAAKSPQERAMLVLLRCGLRQGECLALTEPFLLDKDTILVQYTLTREKNIWGVKLPNGETPKTITFLGRPKTTRSQSKVHIPSIWMPILRESVELSTVSLVRAYDDEKTNGGSPNGRRFVLGNRYGLVWIEWCAAEALRHLMERAKVPIGDSNSTFHAWRHAFCADLVALGCNDSELGLLMRHSDFNLSKAVYASARMSHLDKYRKYRRGIKSPSDYVDAIAKFDEERREPKVESSNKPKTRTRNTKTS